MKKRSIASQSIGMMECQSDDAVAREATRGAVEEDLFDRVNNDGGLMPVMDSCLPVGHCGIHASL
jgi:hypothetical protein